jgi:uncharacterized protein
MNFIKLLISLVIVSSCNAQKKSPQLPINKDDNSLLWEVSGKNLKQPSYIFGTFHLMCKDDIHFSKALNTAIVFAKELYMELDLDDPSTMMGGLLLMNMKDGKKLKDFYTEDEFKRLSAFFKDSIGMSLILLQGMKPSMIESLLYPRMLSCKNSSGVEMELMQLAKKNKKEIKGLETIAFQASVFDSIPYATQAKELLKTIDSIGSYKKYFDTMVNVYKSQQITAIEKLFAKSEFGMEENADMLLYNRNKNWVKQLKDIMKGESVFVAVGAGHLVGEKGLIALLKAQGYTVKPIDNN